MFPYNLTLVYFLHRQKDREGSRSRDAHENTCSHRYLLYSLILPTVDPPLQKNYQFCLKGKCIWEQIWVSKLYHVIALEGCGFEVEVCAVRGKGMICLLKSS